MAEKLTTNFSMELFESRKLKENWECSRCSSTSTSREARSGNFELSGSPCICETEKELSSMEFLSSGKNLQESFVDLSLSAYSDDVISKELRIFLIGKSGNGKSATGNTILGDDVFESRHSPKPVTSVCKSSQKMLCGRDIVVVDGPGIFFDEMPPEKAKDEIRKAIGVLAPGPHIFLFVLSINRIDVTEIKALEMYKEVFGKEIMKHMIIVFTHYDVLKENNMTLDEYCNDLTETQRKVLEECKNRKYGINNKALGKARCDQSETLIKMMLKLEKENGGKFYTNEDFQKVQGIAVQDINCQEMMVYGSHIPGSSQQSYGIANRSYSSFGESSETISMTPVPFTRDARIEWREKVTFKDRLRGFFLKMFDKIHQFLFGC